MKIRTKLLLAILFAAILPLMATSLYVRQMVSNAFTENASEHLATVRENRTSEIQEYFGTINSQIQSMASNKNVVKAMNGFSTAFTLLDEKPTEAAPGQTQNTSLPDSQRAVDKFYGTQFSNALKENGQDSTIAGSISPKSTAGTLLQNLYIVNNPHPLGSKNDFLKANDGSYYSDLHAEFHTYFNRFLNTYGFYDIFLVEPINGNIVYSVYKEVDYATSLKSGPHASSGIARAYNAALGKTSTSLTTLIDYDHYLPSYNSPASFISTPIFDNGTLVGVLIFQMPLDKIDDIINKRTGLGESGKSYLVSPQDGKLRSQLPFYEGNTILSLTADMESINTAMSDQHQGRHIDHFGNEVQISAEYMDILGLQWLISVEKNTAEAFAALHIIERAMWVALGLSILISMMIAMWITRTTQKQLGAEPEFLNTIANEIADGNLTRDFGNADDHTGTLKVMASMQSTLKERDDFDKVTREKIQRLRHGLEKLATPVALANQEHNITFTNAAMRELTKKYATDLRQVIPTLNPQQLTDLSMSQFGTDPSALLAKLNTLHCHHEYELQAGSRSFRLNLNGIIDSDGARIGSSIEWIDITDERRVMKEVDGVIHSARDGELAGRIALQDKDGIYRGLSQRINELLDVTEEFVSEVSDFLGAIADGDLTRSIERDYGGSFASVKTDANRSVGKLLEVMTSIRSVAGTVSTAAKEINTGNLDLSQRTERAAASLEETSSSMQEMTSSVAQNAVNSKQAQQLALAAREHAEKGGKVVGQAVNAMTEINESSLKIADIIGVIDDIAFQTNLLALNASVEAARAGEQGRGFAVVASEVRNLAGRSATAAKEIKELIEDSVNRVKNGAELVNESGKTLEGIVTQVINVTDIVSEISAASQEQSEGIKLVNNTISQLDDATQQNASLVEQASAASQSTTDQAANLIELIGFFSTREKPELHAVATKPTVVATDRTAFRPATKKPGTPANEPRLKPSVKIANSDLTDDWEEF